MVQSVLVLGMALLLFVGPLIGMLSMGVRGYQNAKQQQLNVGFTTLIYTFFGFLISMFIVMILFIIVLAVIKDENAIKTGICLVFTGKELSHFCGKYMR